MSPFLVHRVIAAMWLAGRVLSEAGSGARAKQQEHGKAPPDSADEAIDRIRHGKVSCTLQIVNALSSSFQRRGRRLLTEGERQGRIADIALEAGFSDLSNFNWLFRSRFGDTPGGVRAQTLRKLERWK
jgi:AraC-like DNA-binding protein